MKRFEIRRLGNDVSLAVIDPANGLVPVALPARTWEKPEWGNRFDYGRYCESTVALAYAILCEVFDTPQHAALYAGDYGDEVIAKVEHDTPVVEVSAEDVLRWVRNVLIDELEGKRKPRLLTWKEYTPEVVTDGEN